MMAYALDHDEQGIDMWRHFVESGGVNDKRYHYVLSKWSDRGWWNYGVSLRSGWLESVGREAMQAARRAAGGTW